MYPNSIYFALEVLPIWALWAQSIYYLGTWTLRATLSPQQPTFSKDVYTGLNNRYAALRR